MLEWMHDPSVVENLQANFASKTLNDCECFISSAQNLETDLHMAVVDAEDTYMGTVSLKHIGYDTAEFAITVRASAMGHGYSRFAMQSILEYGIRELELQEIYWCVSPANKRAVRFYDKNGYVRTDEIPNHLAKMYSQELIWYVYK